jgi:hypothetical protein
MATVAISRRIEAAFSRAAVVTTRCYAGSGVKSRDSQRLSILMTGYTFSFTETVREDRERRRIRNER